MVRGGGQKGKHEIGRIAFPYQPEHWDRYGEHGIYYDRPTLQRYARSAVRQLVD